jgi:hypothetical protein
MRCMGGRNGWVRPAISAKPVGCNHISLILHLARTKRPDLKEPTRGCCTPPTQSSMQAESVGAGPFATHHDFKVSPSRREAKPPLSKSCRGPREHNRSPIHKEYSSVGIRHLHRILFSSLLFSSLVSLLEFLDCQGNRLDEFCNPFGALPECRSSCLGKCRMRNA